VATWTIGNVTVTRIEEQLGFASRPPEQYLDGFERETLARHLDWLVPHHYSPAHDRLITSIHSWLIRAGRHTILLDSCAGNHKNRPGFSRYHQLDTPFLQRLREAGVQPEEIDIVLCTHLHADHVGWNTMLVDGRWVPTFPNAKYLFSRIENEIGDPRRNPAADADLQRGGAYRDSVLPVIEAGQAVLVDGDYAIDDILTIVPAAGHTHGHVAVWLANSGVRAAPPPRGSRRAQDRVGCHGSISEPQEGCRHRSAARRRRADAYSLGDFLPSPCHSALPIPDA